MVDIKYKVSENNSECEFSLELETSQGVKDIIKAAKNGLPNIFLGKRLE